MASFRTRRRRGVLVKVNQQTGDIYSYPNDIWIKGVQYKWPASGGAGFLKSNAASELSWSGISVADITGGAAVTAGSNKISLGGSPGAAALAAFSIDVNQANLDHGSVGGLGDDDHALYLLASDATSRSAFASNWIDLTDGGVTTLHSHAMTETSTWSADLGPGGTAVRASGGVYQNTSGRKRQLAIIVHGALESTLESIAYADSSNPPTGRAILRYIINANAAGGTLHRGCFTFEVPNNWYYQVDALVGTIGIWRELDE